MTLVRTAHFNSLLCIWSLHSTVRRIYGHVACPRFSNSKTFAPFGYVFPHFGRHCQFEPSWCMLSLELIVGPIFWCAICLGFWNWKILARLEDTFSSQWSTMTVSRNLWLLSLVENCNENFYVLHVRVKLSTIKWRTFDDLAFDALLARWLVTMVNKDKLRQCIITYWCTELLAESFDEQHAQVPALSA